ncbi:hypothetical protein EUTSA_v10023015mg, partial [Eutrema salsugineum]
RSFTAVVRNSRFQPNLVIYMRFLLQSISRKNLGLIRALSRRYFVASAEEYAKRNYANNLCDYYGVINSITAQRRYYLLRDVYDDMMLDGEQPNIDLFYSLVVGVMKGARLQDAFFFHQEMKSMGIVPDVNVYNFLISTCGKCKNANEAIRVYEEMKTYGVERNTQTHVCLLDACAAAGHLVCVSAMLDLITAHLNKLPRSDNLSTEILELVKKSKHLTLVDSLEQSEGNMMVNVLEEELYNLPTAEYVHMKKFLQRDLTVYHVAFNALADLKDVKAMEALLEMLKNEGKEADTYIVTQIMRCYPHSGDLENGYKCFQDYLRGGGLPAMDLYTTLVEGAMTGYTPKGMQVAQDTLIQIHASRFFLDPKIGSCLLFKAAGEKTGGYAVANLIWDLMQTRKIVPTLPAVNACYNGLKEREITEDDPRLMLVTRIYTNLRLKEGIGSTLSLKEKMHFD